MITGRATNLTKERRNYLVAVHTYQSFLSLTLAACRRITGFQRRASTWRPAYFMKESSVLFLQLQCFAGPQDLP